MRGNESRPEAGERTSPTPTLLICSEVRFLRESLGELLGRDGSVSVIGHGADVAQILRMTQDLRPCVVLLDAATREGASVVRRLSESVAGVRVIVFAVSESVESVLAWAEAGVAGYIPSTASMADLPSLILDISAGRQACSAPVAAGLLQRIGAGPGATPLRSPDPGALTPREMQIVHLISNGLSNKEIARRLNIGLATTKSHVHNALGKLNLQRRGQAATWMHAHARLA